jgi:hypothetical protein
MGTLYGRSVLVLDPEEKRAIDFLKKALRNDFEHFSPKMWVLALPDFPWITRHSLAVIRRLAQTFSYAQFSRYRQRQIASHLTKSFRLL